MPEDGAVPDSGAGGTEEASAGGGPVNAESGGAPVIDVGAVRTEAVENDTVELATRPPAEGDAADQAGEALSEGGHGGDWRAVVRLTYTSASRENGALVVGAEGEYLHDEGGYALHAADFTLLTPVLGAAPDSGDGFERTPAAGDEVLAELAPGDARPFSLRFPDAPERPSEEAVQMVEYTTPAEVWGHSTGGDYTPGRVCVVDDADGGWHDLPLFEYTDYPCG
ncbi:hypothetical protein [Nocardiopsis suaedae]|uniref:Uncharacterized protein n=1 Tax=Nocardiopsis suaedae TaxID=3018444 RepID=A0ABT4TFQ2_9ACTN|nr:hypothetical protein [Nocardiopsis suaedae]MDA2803544.1 hypothetical protein [Nocardiopsis suaedae]